MAAKLVLDTQAMQESYFADTSLMGIASALPAYRLCWLLNKNLMLDFVRDADMDIVMKREEGTIYFPIYCCQSEGMSVRHFLYKLKTENHHLLPEARQLDYIWMVESGDCEAIAKEILSFVKAMPEVQLAQMLDIGRMKSINNLIL